MNYPKVSIIIPVYNVSQYLDNCILNLITQTFKNFEVIFVNDGSTDNSLEILEKKTKGLENFYFYSISNSGVGCARNFGLSIAKGKYIYFYDPDDNLKEDLLSDNIRLIEKFNADMIIFGYIDHNLKTGNEIEVSNLEFKKFSSNEMVKSNLSSILNRNYTNTIWNKIYSKNFLINNKISFNTMKCGEDTVFNWCIYDKVEKVIINPQTYYIYNRNRENSAITGYSFTGSRTNYQSIKFMEKLAKKWGEWENLKYYINQRKIDQYLVEIFNKEESKTISEEQISFMLDLYADIKQINIKGVQNYKYRIKLLDIKYFRSKIMISNFWLNKRKL